MELIQNKINEFDSKISDLNYEIQKIKQYKKEYMQSQRINILVDKIKRYEERWSEGSKRTIETLVLKDETFEQWYERVGSHCNGATNRNSKDTWLDVCLRYYNQGGLNIGSNGYMNYYMKWLIEVKDVRLTPYKIYEKCTETR